MLRWLFRKSIARAEALESYLSHFDEHELAHLKNLKMMPLAPGNQPTGELSKNDRLLLVAYIQAEWLVARGQMEANPVERGVFRSSYNMELARDVAKVENLGVAEFFGAISPHQLNAPEFSTDEEERLGMHATVLDRLFVDPKRPATLPELEEIGEGTAWLRGSAD